MSNFEERAKERFDRIQANYCIPNDIVEFYIKEGIKLQEEYKDVPAKETKRRHELLSMADDLLRRTDLTKLKVKQDIPKTYKNILIVCDTQVQANILYDLYNDYIIGNDNIAVTGKMTSMPFIKTYTGVALYFSDKKDDLCGQRYNQYFNLTNDIDYENTVLKPRLQR